jgi:hypothetical protein
MRIDTGQDATRKNSLWRIAFSSTCKDIPGGEPWYGTPKYLGIKALPGGEGMYGDMPGLPHGLAFDERWATRTRLVQAWGTRSTISFEVTNLRRSVNWGHGNHIRYPYSKTRHKSFVSAGFIDPGYIIELTEGLDRFGKLPSETSRPLARPALR